MQQRIIQIAFLFCLPVFLNAETLEDVLIRMDTASSTFTGVTAKLKRVTYTAIIDTEDVESGTMWISRTGSRSRNIRMRTDFDPPNERSVTFQGRKAEIYYPMIKIVHEYDLGKISSLVDQFLLLGFGTSGKDITKDYHVKLLGSAKVNDHTTSHLELIPKSSKTLEHLVKAELWLTNPEGYPIQQKFYWPSDDTITITYSQIKLNPKLSDKDVTLQLPSDVKREFPQK